MLLRSVVLVAPTSLSARAASFRPELDVDGRRMRGLLEQAGGVKSIGSAATSIESPSKSSGRVDTAVLTVLGLDWPVRPCRAAGVSDRGDGTTSA